MSNASEYVVQATTVAPRLVAGVRAQVPLGRVGQVFGQYLEQVYEAGRDGALPLDGQNIFIYRSANVGVLTVDFCVGVTAPFAPVGAVVPLGTPAGLVAMTTHSGDYGRLGEANTAIRTWCDQNGRERAGPSWEVYGHWTKDPADLRTEVYYLLKSPSTV